MPVLYYIMLYCTVQYTRVTHLHARHVGLTLAKRMIPPEAVEGVATDMLRVCAPGDTHTGDAAETGQPVLNPHSSSQT
jgi:hypothetical protein